MLLLLTNTEDLAADYLITELLAQGRAYFRLNADQLGDARYTVEIGTDTRRLIDVDGRVLSLAAIQSVWYRRSIVPKVAESVPDDAQAFVAGEIRHLVEGAVADSSVLWVNSISATELAERKLYQLRIARDLGVPIPDTVVSTSRDVLLAFARNQPKGVICKPIYHGHWRQQHGDRAVYTRAVAISDIETHETVSSCPTLLQARVEKGVDVRVTIIGRAEFAVEIRCATVPPPVDWRVPGMPTEMRECPLPTHVSRLCRNMMDRLGLRYGAFDWIRSDDGHWTFLEVNPAGEWAWIEVELGLPMRQAFIEMFYESQHEC